MNRVRRPPLQHPLVPIFDRAVDSFSVSLSPDTTRHHRGTARNFLSYLGADHPNVQRLDQLRREPHILGWMSRMRSQVPPLATASFINQLIALRTICNELAWTEQLPELAHLIRREDFPRPPQSLPRPLTAEQDQLLQKEFLRRNDQMAGRSIANRFRTRETTSRGLPRSGKRRRVQHLRALGPRCPCPSCH